MGWLVKGSTGSHGRPWSHRECEHERRLGECPSSGDGKRRRFLKSLWLQLAWSTQERLGGRPLFQFLRTFEKLKTKSGCLQCLITSKRIFRIRDNIPIYATNDSPFDSAQSLLLLHKREREREGGRCRFTVGEALVASGLVFACLASRGRTELMGSDDINGAFFAILCCRLSLILSDWPHLFVLLRRRRRGATAAAFAFNLCCFWRTAD